MFRFSDNAALLEQVQLYEAGVVRDREESAMPGGVDITDHQQLFTALFEKVYIYIYLVPLSEILCLCFACIVHVACIELIAKCSMPYLKSLFYSIRLEHNKDRTLIQISLYTLYMYV